MRQDAFEPMKLHLKDTNKRMVAMQAIAAVQRSKYEKVEKQLAVLVGEVKGMND